MNPKVREKELRNFGLLVGGVLSAIGFWPMLFQEAAVRQWAVGVGGFLIACGSLLPQVLAPIHKGWMWVGHMLGWINTRILLGIVFYGIVTPTGIVIRLIGKDTMRQGFLETSSTYRMIKQPRPRSHMRRQF